MGSRSARSKRQFAVTLAVHTFAIHIRILLYFNYLFTLGVYIMKTVLFIIAFVAISVTAFGQSIPNAKSQTFKVWGNCGSCKKTIEKAINQPKIVSANWNKSTKIIAVTFDSTQTSLPQIQKKIAEAGYDNEGATANDEAYSNLHSCCQYDRKK